MAREALQTSTISAALQFGDFKKDWTIDEPQKSGNNFLKWLSMALSWGGMLAGPLGKKGEAAAEAFGALDTILGGVTELIDARDEPEKKLEDVDTENLEARLGEYFDLTNARLQHMLELIMGVEVTYPMGVPPETILPRPRGDAGMTGIVTIFLNNGEWLLSLQEDGPFVKLIEAGSMDIKRKFTEARMKHLGYLLGADTNGNEANRGKDPNVYGNSWRMYKGKGYCFHLFRWDKRPSGNMLQDAHTEKNDHYEKMEKWGFERHQLRNYYQHLLDCYEHSKNDETKQGYKEQYLVGDKPTCFYNLDVWKYTPIPRKCKLSNPMSGSDEGDCAEFEFTHLE